MTRKQWLISHAYYGRHLRRLATPPNVGALVSVQWRIQAMKRNCVPSSRPWVLDGAGKIALAEQRSRFASLLRSLPTPCLP